MQNFLDKLNCVRKMAELLDTSIVHVAEEIAQKIGLVLPVGNEHIKVAGNLLAFEAIKSVTEIIYPAALSSMSFNANGITLAFIQKKLDEINEKIDTLMNVQHKSAKDILKRAIISIGHQNYEDAYKAAKEKVPIIGFTPFGCSHSLACPNPIEL